MPLRHLLYASVSVTPPASLSHLCRTSRIPLWIYSGSLCSHLIFLVHFPHAPVCPTVQAAFMCHVTWGCQLYVSVAPPICICRSFSMPLWHLLYASVASRTQKMPQRRTPGATETYMRCCRGTQKMRLSHSCMSLWHLVCASVASTVCLCRVVVVAMLASLLLIDPHLASRGRDHADIHSRWSARGTYCTIACTMTRVT